MFGVLDSTFPSSCAWVPQPQINRRELSKQACQLLTLSVLVRRLLKRKNLSQNGIPERFPNFWHFVFWQVCGGNDVEGLSVYFLWLEFVLRVWFSFLGKKGTFSRGNYRKEVVGCLVEWLFGRVGKCCYFFGERQLFSVSLTQELSPNASQMIGLVFKIFALGKKSFLPNQHLQCVADGEPWMFYF